MKLTIPESVVLLTVFAGAMTVWAERPQSKLAAEAKISRNEAAKTALRLVDQGTIQSGELEREHGKLIWSFDITKPQVKDVTEVQIDAITGKKVSVKTETAQDEAKEAGGPEKNSSVTREKGK